VTPAVCRASAGAVEHVPVAVVPNLARYLGEVKRGDLWIFGAVGDGAKPMWETDLSGGVALVFGAEGKGCARSCARRATTSSRSRCQVQVESLNVSVAAACCSTRRGGSGDA
jgi:23S rRNA (guanosine2251-2'-O)-methyltransferase